MFDTAWAGWSALTILAAGLGGGGSFAVDQSLWSGPIDDFCFRPGRRQKEGRGSNIR